MTTTRFRPGRGAVTLDEPIRVRLLALLRARGDVRMSRETGLGRATLARAAAGLTIRSACAEVIRLRVTALDPENAPPAAGREPNVSAP